MIKRYFLIPAALFSLAIIYIIVCFFVFISKGKNRVLVARKLKIGSIIIVLQMLIAGPVSAREPEVLCYSVEALPGVELYYNDLYVNDSTININLKENNIINGCLYTSVEKLCFALKDTEGNIVQLENIDIRMRELEEDYNIEIVLSDELNTGSYELIITAYTADDIEASPLLLNDYLYYVYLEIKN